MPAYTIDIDKLNNLNAKMGALKMPTIKIGKVKKVPKNKMRTTTRTVPVKSNAARNRFG